MTLFKGLLNIAYQGVLVVRSYALRAACWIWENFGCHCLAPAGVPSGLPYTDLGCSAACRGCLSRKVPTYLLVTRATNNWQERQHTTLSCCWVPRFTKCLEDIHVLDAAALEDDGPAPGDRKLHWYRPAQATGPEGKRVHDRGAGLGCRVAIDIARGLAFLHARKVSCKVASGSLCPATGLLSRPF